MEDVLRQLRRLTYRLNGASNQLNKLQRREPTMRLFNQTWRFKQFVYYPEVLCLQYGDLTDWISNSILAGAHVLFEEVDKNLYSVLAFSYEDTLNNLYNQYVTDGRKVLLQDGPGGYRCPESVCTNIYPFDTNGKLIEEFARICACGSKMFGIPMLRLPNNETLYVKEWTPLSVSLDELAQCSYNFLVSAEKPYSLIMADREINSLFEMQAALCETQKLATFIVRRK